MSSRTSCLHVLASCLQQGLTVGQGTGRTGRTGRYKVLEAKQQNKFRMNSKGARAESAASMAFGLESCIMPPPPVLIDKPFLIWLTREGQTLPYFAGYIDRDAWKSPPEL